MDLDRTRRTAKVDVSVFFRKSLNLGVLRLNLTKSGIGLSAGVRGAHISKGPRGVALNVSHSGVYYRKQMNKRNSFGVFAIIALLLAMVVLVVIARQLS